MEILWFTTVKHKCTRENTDLSSGEICWRRNSWLHLKISEISAGVPFRRDCFFLPQVNFLCNRRTKQNYCQNFIWENPVCQHSHSLAICGLAFLVPHGAFWRHLNIILNIILIDVQACPASPRGLWCAAILQPRNWLSLPLQALFFPFTSENSTGNRRARFGCRLWQERLKSLPHCGDQPC